MLGRFRRLQADLGASYAVVWAHLRKRYPRARTILITGASSRDDVSVAAVGLAEAAVTLESSTVLLMVMDSAMQERYAIDSAARSVRVMDALSSAQVRSALADASDAFGFTMVVAPAPQSGPDCISLAYAADAAVLVARSRRTRFGEAQLAARLLRQAGLPVAAALLLTKRGLQSRKSVAAEATGLVGDGQPFGERRQVGFGDRPAAEAAGEGQGQTT